MQKHGVVVGLSRPQKRAVQVGVRQTTAYPRAPGLRRELATAHVADRVRLLVAFAAPLVLYLLFSKLAFAEPQS